MKIEKAVWNSNELELGVEGGESVDLRKMIKAIRLIFSGES